MVTDFMSSAPLENDHGVPVMTEESLTESQSHPPRSRLAFRVGTVGHRPNRLKQADLAKLAQVLHDVLDFVRKTVLEFPTQNGNAGLYTEEAPLMRAVSPLAEGSDRLFAEQALSLGYTLSCPLPFFRESYEEDFGPGAALEKDSVERFRTLFDQVTQKLELDGDRSNSGKAYGDNGRLVLNQSDLLVVVWDGDEPAGEGGTVQTLREAFQHRVPVLCIKALAPHPWALANSEDDLKERLFDTTHDALESDVPPPWYDLHETVLSALELPAAEQTRQFGPSLRETYFEERKPILNLRFWWKIFRDGVGSGMWRFPSIRVPDFEATASKDWPAGDNDPPVTRWINGKLRVHYAWCDQLADIYADRYRSTYVMSYLLVALAVFLALLPSLFGWMRHADGLKTFCIIGELACLGVVLVSVWWSRHRRWHDRWMQYRVLTELIRQLKLLIPLGGVVPLPQLPAHLGTYGDPSASWMYWHMRAIARVTGLPTARVDESYVRECLENLRSVLSEQIKFHEINCIRSENIKDRLHSATWFLLVVTVGSIAIHLAVDLSGGHLAATWEALVTLVCAAFPALGAAVAGINNQGEFARISKRSEAMAKRLDQLSDEIERLLVISAEAPSRAKLQDVMPLAARTARLMVDELLDWNVIFVDRPSEVP